ncbi:MAG TPA: cytochrome P450 [Allosphingosinicella sp.]|nr:cytochrome P450 [Allosphingosinicella sp.]
MSDGDFDPTIITPARPTLIGFLVGGRVLPDLAGRIGARLARWYGKPFRFLRWVIAARHDHAVEMLGRDLDFGIAPVNAVKIGEVNAGPFILGMDRSAALERERRGLYEALAAIDLRRLRAETEADIERVLAAIPAGGEIDAVADYARPIAARTARRLFGLHGPSERMLMEVARSVFNHTFINPTNKAAIRDRAIRAGAHMKAWIDEEIARRDPVAPGEDMIGRLLAQGILDREAVQRSIGGTFVGSIDTTTTVVAKLIKLAAGDPDIAFAMRRDCDDLHRLWGWCLDALRLWPHNPALLRSALVDTEIAGVAVRRGDSTVAWTQAAMQDSSIFDDPRRVRPDRDRSIYLHFGGGLHPCTGRSVNSFQIPLLVGGLVRRGLARVGSISWAGPFPNQLPVTLREGPR